MRYFKNVLGMFALLSLSAGAYAEFNLTIYPAVSVVNGDQIPRHLDLKVVARKSASITGMVLNEGNCPIVGTHQSIKDAMFDPKSEDNDYYYALARDIFPLTMGMGDDATIRIKCENLIQAVLQTTRGDIVYEFSY